MEKWKCDKRGRGCGGDVSGPGWLMGFLLRAHYVWHGCWAALDEARKRGW